MREYNPQNNVQKKAYYNDRFYVTPQLPKESIYNDSTFSNDYLSLKREIDIKEAYIQREHLVLVVDKKDNFLALKHIKEILTYDFLVELSAVDLIEQKDGFEVFYELLSTSKRRRIRLKYFITKDEAIDSVEPLFRSADWSEREMFDMFGIKINNHPNLKRILMPDDWVGYPLLKTYPLEGDESAKWYEVDTIFGKDARDEIGQEIRDASAIDRYDTTRFARLGHEVPYGADISQGEPKKTPLAYQEDGGVGLFGARLISEFDEKKTITLSKRR